MLKRDVSEATLEDHFDKTILPKVMQVGAWELSSLTLGQLDFSSCKGICPCEVFLLCYTLLPCPHPFVSASTYVFKG